MKVINSLIVVSILFNIPCVYSQDSHNTQIEKFVLNYNPAFAGSIYSTDVNLNYRTQWSSLNAPYISYGISGSHRFNRNDNNSFLAIGALVSNTKEGNGVQNTFKMQMSLAGHVKLNDFSTIGIGIQPGFIQRTIDQGNLRWGSQFNGTNYDPTAQQNEGALNNTNESFDLGVGIHYNYDENQKHFVTDNHEKTFSFGFSMNHVNRPNISFYEQGKDKLPIRFTLHGQSLFSITNSKLSVGPFFMIQKQGSAMETVLGSKFRYSLMQASKFTGFNESQTISLSLGYRLKDAFMATFEFVYSNYSIGLSYDFNSSKLKYYSNMRGAFELSFRMAIKN